MASYNYTFTSGDTVTPTKLNSARTVSEIVNADIASGAAIVGTKIAPAFGGQDITVSTANRSITNTGNFALSFGTNNTERLRITNDGKVGIGGVPGERLQIDNTGGSGTYVKLTDANNTDCRIGIAGSGEFIMWTSNVKPLVFSTDSTERMRIANDGKVMINTPSNDGRVLTINGTTNDLAGIGIVHSGASAASIAVNSDGAMTFGLNLSDGKTERMRIDASGNVGIGTTIPAATLDINVSSASFRVRNAAVGSDVTIKTITGPVSAVGCVANAPLALITNDTERMRIDGSGNVGIGGTANAAAILDAASTTKGFLPPRMTTAQRDAISTPPAGLVIYNTSTNVLNFYNGSAWGAV